MNQNFPFYERNYTCPICQMNFTTFSMRRSAINVELRETDFHIIYKGPSPLHYSIVVCPVCKYAASKQTFINELPAILVVQLGQALLKMDTRNTDFSKERDLDTVLESYQLAIRTAQLKIAQAGELAPLIHSAAWICREANNSELERAYLDQARKYYLQAYEESTAAVANLSELQVLYLIGELSMRAGAYAEAAQWFNRAASHADIKLNPALEKQIREQWQTVRELNQKNPAHECKSKPSITEFPQVKTDSVPTVPERPVSHCCRSSMQTMSNLYSDQVDWLNRIMNSGYDYSKNLVSRDEIVKSLIDACREYLGDRIPSQFSNEAELKAIWLELLMKK